MDVNQIVLNNLLLKFDQIKSRMLFVIEQLNDEKLNWRPNEESNSIANLVLHISGNIHQRIEAGILGLEDNRDRDGEFDVNQTLSKKEVIELIQRNFHFLEVTIKKLTCEGLLRLQKVRNNNVTVLDVLLQCSTHFSEHLGQILYIGKMKLNKDYITTSIPRKK
ncbi:DUF1572 family protein [Bacillus suaedaesalsae]|uniref:DUF1572 family protein n=1 Tax=Bacillus suaedaesalsae TaxID=2810349 RepID=A0ABS2DH35_9BACI|nr:DUF1572 family protein [Bacillus suaedaesalsae]MBM6617794.1 DUF1572 family protein [Bacillus suaedaesalsae]